jgi:cyclopropane-fatty-acyl-phospholipid synthase
VLGFLRSAVESVASGFRTLDGTREGAVDWRVASFETWQARFGIRGISAILPDGTFVPSVGPAVATLRLKDWRAAFALAIRDQTWMFEAYLAQKIDLVPVAGDMTDALLAAVKAIDEQSRDIRPIAAALHSSRHWWQQNTPFRRAALAVHYSIPAPFWLAFLSSEYPIYSHYLFEDDESHEAWEAACERKLAFALAACKLKPGDRVLNVGEGWGGFMTYAGRRGLRTTGITLNEDSYRACTAKRDTESLRDRCELVHGDFYDYRTSVPFDGITNMGVTEHLTDYDGLLAQYARLLRPGGYVYSDFVGVIRDTPFRSLIQKDVYPGGAAVYLPKLTAAVERNGQLDIVGVWDDRVSYEKTCAAWARNVERAREAMVAGFGERRYRWMWSYLWMSVYAFRNYGNGITGTRVVMRRR